MEKRNRPHTLAWLLNPWILGGALTIGVGLFVLAIVLLWLIRPGPSQPGPATAALNIVPAPTFTPSTDIALPQGKPTPTSGIYPSPPPGEIATGTHVQIHGTGGDGLRLRSDAGLGGQVRLLGSEAEIFRVDDGPISIDGYTWWFLVGPFDETRQGWAVSNYLLVVQNP